MAWLVGLTALTMNNDTIAFVCLLALGNAIWKWGVSEWERPE